MAPPGSATAGQRSPFVCRKARRRRRRVVEHDAHHVRTARRVRLLVVEARQVGRLLLARGAPAGEEVDDDVVAAQRRQRHGRARRRSAPVKVGAGRPSRGLGTAVASCGVRVASTTPTTTSATSTAPATQRVAWRRRGLMPGPRPRATGRPPARASRPVRLGGGRRSGAGDEVRRGRVGIGGPAPRPGYQREQPTDADEQAAGPQPGDERLDDHADGHRSRAGGC